MSKWILIPGLILLGVSSIMYFLQGSVPLFAEWYWPLMQIGIVATIAGSVVMVLRGS